MALSTLSKILIACALTAVVAAIVAVSIITTSSSTDEDDPPSKKILFQDNFEKLDLKKWQHEITMAGASNWQFQMNTNNRSNSYVRNNTLFLKPTFLTDWHKNGETFLKSGTLSLYGGTEADYCTNHQDNGCERTGSSDNYLNPIVSARLRTMKSFSFTYGRVSFDAKLPHGDWLWPTIWMMPRHNQYGSWPSSGEIDILEARGNLDMTCKGNRKDIHCFHSTLHWGPRENYNRYSMTNKEKCLEDGTDFADAFHHYELEWTDQHIQTRVDGELVLDVNPGNQTMWEYANFPNFLTNPWQNGGKMAPFDEEFFLILSLSCGGTNGYFQDGCDNANGEKPWKNTGGHARRDFWDGREQWTKTWDVTGDQVGEGSALQIRNLKVEEI